MHYLIVAISLFGFWWLLSGYFTALLLSLGAVSVLLVAIIQWRLDRFDQEPGSFRITFNLIRYSLWLLLILIKANLQVVTQIISLEAVKPHWFPLRLSSSSPLSTTLYANSITLTPGTLTLDVAKQRFIVHCLSEDRIGELRGGQMETRIRQIGW